MARRKRKSEPRTLVVLVRDKSGSMDRRREATVSGTNEYIDTLREKADGEVLVTLTEFDTHIHDVFVARPIEEVDRFRLRDYKPWGATALYDAIGRAVHAVERVERGDDRVLVVIMTDGLENASKRYTRSRIRELVEDKEDDGWEFIYMGAGSQAWQGGEALGFRDEQRFFYSDWDAHDHQAAIFDVAMAHVASTHTPRGINSSYAYLASSDTKSRLENKAKTGRPDKTPVGKK